MEDGSPLPSSEERLTHLMNAFGGEQKCKELISRLSAQPGADHSQQEQTEANKENEDGSWNVPVAPAIEAAEEDEKEPESLKLQRQFREEKGYDWWDPPADKIVIRGYRPPPGKQQTQPTNPTTLADIELTLDPRCGEPAPRNLKFTPFAAICKFPYKFVPPQWLQPLASAIFDGDKIQSRDWDLYYVFNNLDCPRPCVFVPESQFEDLLKEINDSFPEANIRIGQDLRDEGLVIDFSEFEDEDLRPRWLGHSTSRPQTDGWPGKVQQTITKHDNMSKAKDVELFKQKMDAAYEIGRQKKAKVKKERHEAAKVKRHGMAKELSRAQKYLGLLPQSEESLLPDIVSLSVSPIDHDKPAPHPFADEPIFIAIDVEAYEREPKPVTEVGVATLDTRDLKAVAPGKFGEQWQGAIRARHFRVAEYKQMINKDFVAGCPDHFDFGTSEVVGKDKVASVIASCFHAPFSAAHMVNPDLFNSSTSPSEGPSNTATDVPEEKRNIIFLGHDVDNDIAYLRRIGFDVTNRGNMLEVMDTRSMYQAYTHDPQPTSLARILDAFDQAGWHLHNAGNDAVYTVWALLAMAVTAAGERGSAEATQRRVEALAKREAAAVEDAKERVKEGAEGWSDEEGGVKVTNTQDAGVDGKTGKGKGGFVPWTGSETGLYTAEGYPLNV